jgi:hypothetical protein
MFYNRRERIAEIPLAQMTYIFLQFKSKKNLILVIYEANDEGGV